VGGCSAGQGDIEARGDLWREIGELKRHSAMAAAAEALEGTAAREKAQDG
jgi:hypothetical protein